MFKKRTCKNCGEKINENYKFCPHCGSTYNDFDEGQWGMLGKNDLIPEIHQPSNLLGGLNQGMLGKMFNSAMRVLEKEMQKEMKDAKNLPHRTNMRLMVNGKEIPLNNLNKKEIPEKKLKTKIPNQFSEESSKKFSKLPKQEPKTNIRRLSNKVIYEIEMPDVKSSKDISIIKLESSIEIKAIGKNHAYLKRIPINLPIIDYIFSKEKLTLELGVKS